MHRVIVASFLGNLVEWFDYAVYGYLAATISVTFFPESSQTAGLLATFGLFAVSFLVRPLGGIFWGYFGDRNGRRAALSASILIMSSSTVAIGLLPTYAQIGVAAPALLLFVRLAQGFSAAGEYAGAAAYLHEYAPERARGKHTSVVPASTATGLLVGSLSVTLLTQLLSAEQMSTWGWRLPFLLAAPLGLIGRYIRLRLEDTPEYRDLQDRATTDPLRETFHNNKRAIAIGFGATCLNAVGFYLLLSYMPTYLSEELGIDTTASFLSTTLALVVYIASVFFMGRLSDRFGRANMMILAGVLFAVFAVPAYWSLGTAGAVGVTGLLVVLGMMLTINDATLPSYLAELFPTHVRFSGFAFSFNTANAVFGGTAPFIATTLIHTTGSATAPAAYLAVAGIAAAVCVLMGRKARPEFDRTPGVRERAPTHR